MTRQCTHCGKILRDDVRFCNGCGTPLEYSSRPPIREQIAQQPPSRPPVQSVSPPQMRPPNNGTYTNPRSIHDSRGNVPARLTRQDFSDSPLLETAAVYPEEDLIEDLPTSELPAHAPAEDLPTSPLLANPPMRGIPGSPIFAQPPSYSGVQEVQERRQIQPSSAFVSPNHVSNRASTLSKPTHSRLPLIVVLTLLFMLIVGGLIALMVAFQPFTVPAITQPQQSFQDSSLGIFLQYPNGWSAHVDQKKQSVSFYDSSQTDQVSILAAPANGMNASQYLQQEATQPGMTGLKAEPPLSFAGTTWQQAQVNVVLKGASYTERLLVTSHAGRNFVIMQLAPQITYLDEERVVFSSIRSSFRFLS